MTATITFDLSLLYFVAANIIAILSCVLFIKSRTRRNARDAAILTNLMVQYFRNTGVEVSVRCISLQRDDHFIAFIESEPMKRFRLSHMIETSLRDHINAICALQLDNVYWRFIIKEDGHDDAYIRDGLGLYEPEESSLEAFEKVAKTESRQR